MASSRIDSPVVAAGGLAPPLTEPRDCARPVQAAHQSAQGGRHVRRIGPSNTAAVVRRATGIAEPGGQHDALPQSGDPPRVEFWTIREVEAAVKLKKSAIYARIARRAFPRPVKLSSTVSVWVESEVRLWMQDAVGRRGEY